MLYCIKWIYDYTEQGILEQLSKLGCKWCSGQKRPNIDLRKYIFVDSDCNWRTTHGDEYKTIHNQQYKFVTLEELKEIMKNSDPLKKADKIKFGDNGDLYTLLYRPFDNSYCFANDHTGIILSYKWNGKPPTVKDVEKATQLKVVEVIRS